MRKAGASTPASPEPTTTRPVAQNSSGPGPALHIRDAKATGQEAQFLHEAAQRLEAVSTLLAAAALEHVAPGDLVDTVTPLITVIDDAARFVNLAGGE